MANPFQDFTPEEQQSIEQQLRALRASGKLNDAQNKSVGQALLNFIPAGTPSFSAAEPGGRGILGKVAAAVGLQKPTLAPDVGQGGLNRVQFQPVSPRRYQEEPTQGGPILSPSELLPNKQFTNPTPAGAVGKGVGNVVAGLTTPDNVLITLMTAGIGGEIIGASKLRFLAQVPGLRQLAAKGLTGSNLLGAYFGTRAGIDLVHRVPGLRDEWQQAQDNPTPENIAAVTEHITEAVAGGAIAGAGLSHGLGYEMPVAPDWMKRGAGKVPDKINLKMEGSLVDLGWTREQVKNMRPEDAHAFIKNQVRAEDYKPPVKPNHETTALAIRPKNPAVDLVKPEDLPEPLPAGKLVRTLPPVPKPPEEMGPPAVLQGKQPGSPVPILSGRPGEPVPIVEGGRSAYFPGVPPDLQAMAHYLEEKKASILQDADRARKAGNDKAAAEAERQLKVIDRRRVQIGLPEETPSAAAPVGQGVPAPPPPPGGMFGEPEAPRAQETQSSPAGGNEPPAIPASASSASAEGPGGPSAPPTVAEIPTKDVIADPKRFQFRSLPRAGLSEIEKYRPELSGVLTVWKDPADGKTYVVNGHHRLDLAVRTDTPTVRVQYINAPTAQEARAQGALINIAEGSADPIDAARFFRDTGATPEKLESYGVSLSGPVAGDAMALARLSSPLFNQVVTGEMPTGRAVAIGKYLTDHAEQEALVQLIKQQGQKGDRLNNGEIEALARYVKSKGTTTTSEPSLFGNQEIEKSNAIEHAQLEAYIKKRLSKDKRLFGFVAKGPRAEELKRAGNIIDVDKSAEIAQAARVSEEVFNRLLDRTGPLSSALSEGARRIAAGEDAGRVRSETYEKALTAISQTLGGANQENGGGNAQAASQASGASGQPQAPVKPITTADSLSGRTPRRFRETVPPPPAPPPEPPENATVPGVAVSSGGTQFDALSPDKSLSPLSAFAKETVAPTARQAAANVVSTGSWLKRTFAPELIDDASKRMSLIVRDKLAWLENERTRTNEAMREFEKHFDQMPRQAQIRAQMQFESRGAASFEDPIVRRAFEQWQQMQQETWRQVASRKGIRTFIENYFPHLWKNPEEAAKIYGQVYAKRPLEGPKSFFKKRGLPSIADGLEAGLELADTNPVRVMEAKLHEMRRFIAGHDIMEEAKQNGMVTMYSVYKSQKEIPEGMRRVEGPMGNVFGKPTATIREAYDMNLMDSLNEFARSLGIEHYRKVFLGNGIMGYTKWPGSEVFTRFATPMGTLTHEIGHQLDFRYGIAKQMVKDPEFKQELRDLADERYRNKENVTPNYQKYVRKGTEKIANLVDAMVNAPDLAQRVAPRSVKFLQETMAQHDELRPFLDIKPSLARAENTAEIRLPGPPLIGHLYMPDGAATILNNHLSPGLRNSSPLFKGYLAAANVLNRFQLGWSLFHFSFTGLDASISRFELGIRQALSPGRNETRGQGLANMGKAIIPGWGAVESLMQGSSYMKSLLETGPDAELRNLALREMLNQGGGRIKMDSFYQDSSVANFWAAWRSGNKIGAAFRAPMALVEEVSKPIMEQWVPRLKLGIYYEMAQHEIAKLPENADVFQKREALAKAWNSVDNRLGQLVYDNLFWNKALKDLGLASVRSLGWNLGSIREFGGGTLDLAKGKLTPKAAYIIALPVVVGIQGAMLGYMLTGEGPKELKDYYFPRTGKVNPDGTPERIVLPSYAKDLYNYGEGFRYGVGEGLSQAGSTVSNKMNPMIGAVMDMLHNRDFYGTKIYNADDPFVQQVKDGMTYAAGQFMPLSAHAFVSRRDQTGAPFFSKESLESILGLMPAPKSIERTKAEYLTAKYISDQMPRGARDRSDVERAQMRGDLIRRLRLKDEGAYSDMMQNIQSGQMSFSDRSQILERVRRSSLETGFTHLGIKQAITVYEAANSQEKELLKPLLLQKAANTRKLSPGDWIKMREKVYGLISGSETPTSRPAEYVTPEVPRPQ